MAFNIATPQQVPEKYAITSWERILNLHNADANHHHKSTGLENSSFEIN